MQKEMAAALGVAMKVDFCVNASASQVRKLLGGAVGGLHSMVDEHFGISVVEYMAAGKHTGKLCLQTFSKRGD